ncbi:MAG: phosphoenolpyruvate synthase [Bacteroides sp.]|nr:phosphoenolpyruvate synthase [Bacteroides sp.]MCM1379219.1 phosphoenolpyruvate synthase [Bacteroides sp.]MCM1445132.1 phosphoenolpyruvate synthase [Prevotella sp.]
MQRRIHSVLLIASPYDAFIMEEDGRVEEQLFFEYNALNLSSPPRVTRVSSTAEALSLFPAKQFDLIIAIPGPDIPATFAGLRDIRRLAPATPLVVLTPFSKEVSRRLAAEDLSAVDYVFSWLGNMDLILAIIKLLEDKMNADYDVNTVGIQTIMLVEDSVRFYSSILPHLYKFLLQQSQRFSTEALNEHEQMLRMRGRPKVILARTYEEATDLYAKYGSNMLGIITDVSFSRGGQKDTAAGLRLAEHIRRHDPYVPIIVESSEVSNSRLVEPFNGIFLDKNSKKLPLDLGEAITANFGFGDFVMRDPDTLAEIMRITSLKDLQYKLMEIPDKTLYYHARRNDISRWLYARALFAIAEVIKQYRTRSIDEVPQARLRYLDAIVSYRRMKNRGVVAVFRKDRFDRYSNFARIGRGSMGGKGRGLAFIDSIIKKYPQTDGLDGTKVQITIPRTVVLCTDVFDEFMASNGLYPLALSQAPDAEIHAAFVAAHLPESVCEDLRALLEVIDKPMAIRSSSLLEDSHYQPFAGVYATYMIQNRPDRREETFRMLCDAIKSVYASVFYADSKAYMTATSNVIDQEKMAVIIQEVVGIRHADFYFPSFSGVGRSLNYYPIGDERAEDGVAQVAIGLGKTIVEGGTALRFSPKHPAKVLQTSTLDLALRDTQTRLLALDMTDNAPSLFTADDGFNLRSIRIQSLAGTEALRFMVSTYDVDDRLIRNTDSGPGRKVVTFANMLQHGAFPLAQSVDFMLETGQREMARPVEIEFAAVVNGPNAGTIYWLQIRPIVDKKEVGDERILSLPDDQVFLKSHMALGNGNIEGVRTVVYVRPEAFNSANNPALALEIESLNRRLMDSGEPYILIGPGRWGSSDPALGIPVKWPHICGSRLIVECALPGYRIEPSQGTHFFQNLTSVGCGYFTVDGSDAALCDFDYLNALEAFYETPALRAVRFSAPLPIALNGRTSLGKVAKP